MARQIFNQGLPNFFVVDSPLEIRELMRKSSTLLFVPTLALQRKFIEDSLTAAGMLVHRLDEAMWAAQKVVVPGPAHLGRVLSSYITEASGWRIDAAEVQIVGIAFDEFAAMLSAAPAQPEQSAAQPEQPAEVPPVLARDLAEILGSTVPVVCAALVEAGKPPRSTNMAVSGEEALIVARALKQPAAQGEPVAIVVDAYDTPGLQWLCQLPPKRGDRLYAHPQQASKPMTDEQARELCKEIHGPGYMPSDLKTVRATERFYNIKE